MVKITDQTLAGAGSSSGKAGGPVEAPTWEERSGDGRFKLMVSFGAGG